MKEQEMEVDNQRLIEEERTRISRLQAIESKQRQMEDNWRREYTLMKKKEEDLLMERQRQETEEQNRIDRMYELEMRQKQTEEEQRQQVLRNLKAEDDRREYEVRGRLLKEREQEQRKLQRQAAEQRKREQEIQAQLESRQREPTLRDLKEEEDIRERAVQERIRKEQEHMELRKRASEQREREKGMHDQQERLMNWEADVRRKQEQNPTTDRLGMLFEAEQRLAHAIQEEIQRKEEQQKESEQIPTYQSRSRLGNTLLMNKDGPGNVYVKPTVTSFSGTEPIPKNECSFEIWTLEVECIMNTYPDYLVSQAIRQSLKGEAKRVLLPLGPHATAQAIIEKMESVFGNVFSGESVLQQFYSSRQTYKETVTSWGLRLEGVLQKAIRKGQIHPEQRNEMLRIKFWRGLQSDELRNATRMAFETERDFEVLRKKVRSEECEIETNRKDSKAVRSERENQEPIQQQQIQLNKDKSMFADLLSRMERMEQKMNNMSRNRSQGGSWYSRNKNQKPEPRVRTPEQPQKRPDGSLN